MKEFKCDVEHAKVNGSSVSLYLSAFGSYIKRGQQTLCRYFGVDELSDDLNTWYSLSKFLEAMEEFQKQFGQELIHKMGSVVFEKAVFPPELDSVEKAMQMANMAYYMNHQCEEGEIGGYSWEKTSDNSGIIVSDSPYPCAFDQGLLESMVKKFAPDGKVDHDDSKPCRHQGDDSCTFLISW